MALKQQTDINHIALKAIDDQTSELNQLSQDIWTHPELGYQENHAHQILTEFLEKEGFRVERNFIHETGFRATFGDNNRSGDGGVNVCVICEYDALPGIGHACGHNLIAECGVAAGLGIKAALEKIGCGQVTVLGTPAEEGGGGKLAMIEAKVFDSIDIALMAHPCPHNIPRPPLLANQQVHISFTGKASHAAAFPWDGVNALDAAVLCYQSISVMRQQMKPTWRVHGIFTDAGVKPNIIPEKAELYYYLRAPTKAEVDELKSRVEGCIQGAASASGCQASFKYTMRYLNLVSNHHLATVYEKHATDLGLEFSTDESVRTEQSASGDIGNVSQVVPTIQPGYSIHTKAVNHSKEFAQAAGSAVAHNATLLQAKVLALTALDILSQGNSNNSLLDGIKQEFQETFGPSMNT